MRSVSETRLLVTGFGPFPGAPLNPSARVVTILATKMRRFARAGIVLETCILPVTIDAPDALDAQIARSTPDVMLHLGVAGRRRVISVETRAINRISTLHPDARGRFAQRGTLRAKGASLTTKWNNVHVANALRGQGFAAARSIDAGTYICNAVFFHALSCHAMPALFIHIPSARRIAPKTIALALARILPGLVLPMLRRSSSCSPAIRAS